MLPIDSPWVTSYSTSIDHNIVSDTTILKYLTCDFDDLEPWTRSSKVKGYGVNRKPMGDFLLDFYW